MKLYKLKSLLVLAAVGAIALTSCSKEDTLMEKEFHEADIDSRLAKITITAFNGEEEPASKTVLAGEKLTKIHWLANEEIAVFDYKSSDKPNKFTSTNTEQSATATFDGSIAGITDQNELEGKEFIGLYPYNANATISDDGTVNTTLPDVQEAVANSFASNLMIAMGKSTTNATKMKFFNVCGGLCFTVSHEDIRMVVIRTKDGKPIAGNFTVKFVANDEGKEVPMVQDITNGKSSITINAPKGKTFKKDSSYYIVTLPQVMESGIVIEGFKDDGTVYELDMTKALSFKRSIFGRKKNFDQDLKAQDLYDYVLEVIMPEFDHNGGTKSYSVELQSSQG